MGKFLPAFESPADEWNRYYWAHELAGENWRRQASYVVGWFSWAGSIFCSASVALALAFIVVGLWQLSHPD
jgi:choline transport protein